MRASLCWVAFVHKALKIWSVLAAVVLASIPAFANWVPPSGGPQIHGNGPHSDTWTYLLLPNAAGMQPSAVIASTNSVNHPKVHTDRMSDPAELKIIHSPAYDDWAVFFNFGNLSLTCAAPSCPILMQFDDGDSEEVEFLHYSSANQVPIKAVHSLSLLKKIAGGHKLKVVLPVTQLGDETFEFDIAGLDLEKIKPSSDGNP